MAHATSAGRPVRHRLGLLLTCCALLLVAAGCGDDDSVFTTNPDGSGTQTTLPGGLVGPGDQGGPDDQGSGSNPGGTAAAIPVTAQAYAGIDLGALPAIKRLADAFAAADPAGLAEDLGDAGDGVGEAVEGVQEARDVLDCLGESLAPDPASLPAWVGDEAGLGAFDMAFDAATGEMSEANLLAVVEVADQAAAAAALPGVIASLGTCTTLAFQETDYQGVAVYRADPGDGSPPMAAALIEGYVAYGLGAGTVERAIDLGDGPSLADDPSFSEVVAALPSGRHLSAFMGPDLLQQVMAGVAGAAGEAGGLGLPSGLDPTQALQGLSGLGLAATLLDEGVRVALVAVGDSESPLPGSDAGASDLPDLLPADTILFAGIGGFDVPAAWGSLLEVLAQLPVEEGQPSVQDTITLIGTMLGVDIEQDFVNQLTGEVGVGLLPATAGSLAAGGVNLGLIAVLGVRDPGAMAATASTLAEGIARMSETPASPHPFEGGTLYGLSDGTSDIALFGMAGDNLVITTHESHAAALLAGGDKLAGSSRYAEAMSGLPEGATPFLFLDVAALVAALPQEDGQGAGIAPLQTVGAGFSGSAGAAVMTIYARIDY
jgi:hypothetical protein